MPRKSRERSKTLFNKRISLEELNMKKSDRRQQPKKGFLLMSKRSLFLNRRLRCILNNSILRREEKRLSMPKDWLFKSKREKCMQKSLRFRTPRRRPTRRSRRAATTQAMRTPLCFRAPLRLSYPKDSSDRSDETSRSVGRSSQRYGPAPRGEGGRTFCCRATDS